MTELLMNIRYITAFSTELDIELIGFLIYNKVSCCVKITIWRNS